MSTSEPLIEVQVVADRATETFLIDHTFRMAARGLGSFSAKLPPGLYKAKHQLGTEIVEHYFEVPRGSTAPVRVTAPDTLDYSSSAPLAKTSNSGSDHLFEAAKLSREQHAHFGIGAEIFLFARSWMKKQSGEVGAVSSVAPADGLSLHHLDGTKIIDYATQSARSQNTADPWAGFTAVVDPGAYRLRFTPPDGRAIEQCVIASPGWQTQVFLLVDRADKSRGDQPNLATASILMARLGVGFTPEDEMLRLSDAARVYLTSGRTAIARASLQEIISEKFENPMLAIYAAQALSNDDTDAALVGQLLSTLHRLLGTSHPDVAALSLCSNPNIAGSIHIEAPPMLRSSWTKILDCATEMDNVMAEGSLATQIPRDTVANTAWLIWPVDALVERTEPAHDVLPYLQSVLKLHTGKIDDLISAFQLDDKEQQIVSFLDSRARFQERASSSKATIVRVDDMKSMARAFGVTVGTAKANVASLADKFRGQF
jgi:hypothetical protein